MGDLVLVGPQLGHLLVGQALEVIQWVICGADLGGCSGKSTSKSSESELTTAAAAAVFDFLVVFLPLPAPLPLPCFGVLCADFVLHFTTWVLLLCVRVSVLISI